MLINLRSKKQTRRMDDDITTDEDGTVDTGGGDNDTDGVANADDDVTADTDTDTDSDTDADNDGTVDDDADTEADDDAEGDDDLEEEGAAVESLGFLVESCEMYGMSKTALDFAQRAGLLTGTGIATCSVESFGSTEALTQGLEDMKEGLMSRIKAFLAKCMDKIKGMAGKVGDAVMRACSFIKEKAKAAGGAIKESVSAHPYAWAAGAVAMIAAIGVTIAGITGAIDVKALTGGDEGAIQKAFEKIRGAVRKIRLPGGKSLDVKLDGNKLSFTEKLHFKALQGQEVAAKAGGWTSQKAQGVADNLSRSGEKVVGSLRTFGSRISEFSKGMIGGVVAQVKGKGSSAKGIIDNARKAAFNNTGRSNDTFEQSNARISKGVGFGVRNFRFILSVVGIVGTLVTAAVGFAIAGIAKTFHKLFGGGKKEEEA